MFAMPFILVDSDTGVPKWLPFAIIMGIWLLGAMTAVFKKSRKSNVNQPQQPPARKPALAGTPKPPRPPRQPPKLTAPARAKRKGSATPQLPVQKAPARRERMAQQAPPAAPPPVKPRAAAAPSIDAATIARWMTPRTLRSQYILTEVFDPPAALREPEGPAA